MNKYNEILATQSYVDNITEKIQNEIDKLEHAESIITIDSGGTNFDKWVQIAELTAPKSARTSTRLAISPVSLNGPIGILYVQVSNFDIEDYNTPTLFWETANDHTLKEYLNRFALAKNGEVYRLYFKPTADNCIKITALEENSDIKLIQSDIFISDISVDNEMIMYSESNDSIGQLYLNSYHGEIFNDYKKNIASGSYSHAEGQSTIAEGRIAHSEGVSTMANIDYSHAEGVGTLTEAKAYRVASIGRYSPLNAIEILDRGDRESDGIIIEIDSSNVSLFEEQEFIYLGPQNIKIKRELFKFLEDVYVGDFNNSINKIYQMNSTYGTFNPKAYKGEILPISYFAREKQITLNADATLITDGVEAGMHVVTFSDGYKIRGTIAQVVNETTILIDMNGDGKALFEEEYLKEGNQLLIDGGKYGNKAFQQDNLTEFPSHAEGTNTVARLSAHAEGIGTDARAFSSHVEGGYGISSGEYSHAEGYKTEARGHTAHAEGVQTYAKGQNSHAEGSMTKAMAANSHTEGYKTEALLDQSHAEGHSTIASGGNSHAEGKETKSIGLNSHAEGENTQSVGRGSHTEGINTYASHEATHAEGYNTKALGKYSHTEGYNTTASGMHSHTEGTSNVAKGTNSHAEGHTNEAWGSETHIEGYSGNTYDSAMVKANLSIPTTDSKYGTNEHIIDVHKTQYKFSLAKGNRSHVEGQQNLALGDFTHAEGVQNRAIGENSHVEGWNNIANGTSQHVQGRFNKEDKENKYAHIVGNGIGPNDNQRRNIHTVDWDGNAEFAGDIYAKQSRVLTEDTLANMPATQIKFSDKIVVDYDGTVLFRSPDGCYWNINIDNFGNITSSKKYDSNGDIWFE